MDQSIIGIVTLRVLTSFAGVVSGMQIAQQPNARISRSNLGYERASLGWTLINTFHDTHGRALENIDVSLERGLRVFDASVGGLGGCPYAPGAKGNVATGAVIDRLTGSGFEIGIDRKNLPWPSSSLPTKFGEEPNRLSTPCGQRPPS